MGRRCLVSLAIIIIYLVATTRPAFDIDESFLRWERILTRGLLSSRLVLTVALGSRRAYNLHYSHSRYITHPRTFTSRERIHSRGISLPATARVRCYGRRIRADVANVYSLFGAPSARTAVLIYTFR